MLFIDTPIPTSNTHCHTHFLPIIRQNHRICSLFLIESYCVVYCYSGASASSVSTIGWISDLSIMDLVCFTALYFKHIQQLHTQTKTETETKKERAESRTRGLCGCLVSQISPALSAGLWTAAPCQPWIKLHPALHSATSTIQYTHTIPSLFSLSSLF